jgi:aminoglycoside 6-adenylyltransferase
MTKRVYSFEKFLHRLTLWAKKRDDVRAAVVLGSRARTELPADEWSDLDIMLAVNNPAYYLDSTDWLKAIDEVKILFLETLPMNSGTERRVLFECGLDVDFIFASAAQLKKNLHKEPDELTRSLYSRGYKVLFDKDSLIPAPDKAPETHTARRMITEEEFTEAANDFWYHSVWTAKKLRRGELWTALRCCDIYMKNLLLKAIECHARLLHGERYDTWYNGRFLEQWADGRIVKDMENCYARYSRKDIRRALLATMDLFRWITREIAEKTGYAYPVTAEEYATGLVGTLLPE